MDSQFWQDIAEASKALLTPTIAVAAAVYARRQSVTAKNKLRLDLFDRRYVMYRAVVEAIFKVSRQGTLSLEDRHALTAATRGARWLFDERVGSYIDDSIRKNISTLMFELAAMQEGESNDYSPPAPEYDRIRAWFRSQQREVDDVFGPHLALQERSTFRYWVQSK